MISYFANPHRFMKLSGVLTPWLFAAAGVMIAYSLWQALWIVRPETYQGDSARIMFIHVPAAWLSMAGYAGLAVSSFIWFVWRHELADMAAKAMAPVGAAYTAICLATGSIWGKPTWGTWWQWEDPRMTSVLVLLFLYLGYIAIRAAMDTRQKAARAAAILAMVGVVNVPIIKFSVDIWASIHQTASVVRLDGPSMPAEYLVPLLIAALGHSLLFTGLLFTGMRADVHTRRADALVMRRLQAAE
ncbi:MAG: heme ABC transporter permease CcmC [Pseudomonadota bacterium]